MKLIEALQAVADSSFYEDLIVTPLGNGEYAVDRTSSEYGADSDRFEWTPDFGFQSPETVETAGFMESYELFDSHKNIEHYLPESIEHLKDGYPVEYAYTVVYDGDVTYDVYGNVYDPDGELTDDVVGWTLTALAHI